MHLFGIPLFFLDQFPFLLQLQDVIESFIDNLFGYLLADPKHSARLFPFLLVLDIEPFVFQMPVDLPFDQIKFLFLALLFLDHLLSDLGVVLVHDQLSIQDLFLLLSVHMVEVGDVLISVDEESFHALLVHRS